MYYILTSLVEDDREDAILEGDSVYLDRIECFFGMGYELPLLDIETPIQFQLDENSLRGKMTDHLNVNDIPGPIFSLRTKTLFEKAGIQNIEYYQLTLQDEFFEGVLENERKGDEKRKVIEYTDYFIANVVGLADCVDHERSTLDYFYPPELRNQEKEISVQGREDNNDPFADENPNDIDFITKLVLDESKVDPKLKVFRLKDQPDLLVFHESIVSAIRKENLSGFVFVPVSEYTDAIPDDVDDTEDEEEKKDVDVRKELPQPKQVDKPKEEKQTEEIKIAKKSRFGFST